MIARTYDDADRNADRELLDNDPGTTTTCASCERETPAPTSRIAGDLVMCEHCGRDVHTGESLDAWVIRN
jgi:ribosomal protein L37AE/L43A